MRISLMWQMKKGQKPKSLKEQIALNVRLIRENADLSREDLAKKAKVSARYIYIIETGKRNISIDTLEAIANALGTSVCDIICTPDRPSNSRAEALELAITILNDQLMKTQEKK